MPAMWPPSNMLEGGHGADKPSTATPLDTTLRFIDEIANKDVEMQVPLTEQWAIIVLDTNILIDFLDTIKTFVGEVQKHQLPVSIIVPGAVIHELDVMHKKRDTLSWFARRASRWLLSAVKERKNVKGQALDETCKPSGNWKTKEQGGELGIERENDGLILDCCLYFFRARQCRTFLCSKDKLLAVEAESVGIPTLFPNERSFCSRDMAVAIFGPEALGLAFSEHLRSYHGNMMPDDGVGVQGDDDGMDVDDDSTMTKLVRPSHPLDLLHLQVIEHFEELLLELAAKVAGREGQKFGPGGVTSIHAPAYARKQMRFWTATDSLEFLNAKKRCPASSPRVEVFLMRPRGGGTGARPGREWTRRDWEVALCALGRIGEMWADGAGMRESVDAAEVQLRCVFGVDM